MNDLSLLQTQNYLGGEWIDGNGAVLEVRDKFHGNLLSKLNLMNESQLGLVTSAVNRGFQALKSWSAGQKSDLLSRLAQDLTSQKEWFARLITAESGKPLSYARAETERCISTLNIAAREALQLTGETIPMDFANGTGKTAFTRLFPLGPVLGISPFNFPLNLALHKIAPALAAGCPIVLKPSPYAPLTCLAFARLCEQAGCPEGSVNVLQCDVPFAEKLVREATFKLLSFTGSAATGWYLKSICGTKKIILELGGNAAALIDESADVPFAAKALVQGSFLFAGQICISTQRIYVHENRFNEFVEQFLLHTSNVAMGDPHLPETVVGPLIDRNHLLRVDQWVTDATKQGAKILAGGKIADESHNLYQPTVLTRTTPEMKVVCEEVFGPVVIIESFKNLEAGIEAVNQSRYGLQASIFTNHLDSMRTATERLEVGAVIVNQIPGFRIDSMPYGGLKDSGLGREGLRYAIRDMTEPRLLVF
ncbi:MAG: aldehyde dehydrogenase family protein [SAR324 cluster bacterium]|nr:aldehyde dehydrogenase family protein [SAR324 cluster bacterium]